MEELCPDCGGATRLDPEYVGPHAGKIVCSSCGRFVAWQRKEWTPARAATFRLFFGKYKNATIAEVGQMDRSYLRWLASECETESVRRAAICHLEAISPKVLRRGARA